MSPQSGMSAQLSEVRSGSNALAVPFARPRIRPEKALRYELNVVADDVVDVVSGIGGWLFDRAMAGWRVSVAADEAGDGRALRILGLKAVGRSELWRSAEADAVVMTAIGPSRFDPGDHTIAVRNPDGDVVFFGAQSPDGLGQQAQRARYWPSAAALAFKAHALAVAGAEPASADTVETLFRCGRPAGLLDADLVPVW